MSFKMATLEAAHTPLVRELPVKAAEVWPRGSLVLQNASGEFEECGADPVLVAAVTLSGYGNTLSFGMLRSDGFPTGRCQGVWVGNRQAFRAKYVGTKPAAPDGTKYAVVVDSDGLWKVDFSDTSHDVVEYVRDLEAENLGIVGEVLVVFDPAVVQPLS